jgi:AcrR family transcriptional regulator
MTSSTRRARERMHTQELILNAARDLFVKQGYEAVTMRAVAAAIEYTPGALYAHFKDKADLVRALCINDFSAFNSFLYSLHDAVADPVARICKMGRGYLLFAASHPRQYEFMFLTKLPADVSADVERVEREENPENGGYAFLVRCVKEAIDAGLIREDLKDEWLVAQLLWAGLHGISAIAITFEGDPCHKKLADIDVAGREMRRSLMLGLARDQQHVHRIFSAEQSEPLRLPDPPPRVLPAINDLSQPSASKQEVQS